MSILLFFPLFLGEGCGEAYAQCNTWTQKTNFGGTARRGAVGFSIGNKGYIGTGYDGSYKKDFWEYDMPGNTWSQKADLSGPVRAAPVGFSIGSKGYIGTGSDGVTLYQDFWEYDTSSNTWTSKADFGGTARAGAVGFSIGSKGYIGTGSDVDSFRTDFWQYDPILDNWAQKANFGGTARYLAVGFSIGPKGYIGTGNSCGAVCFLQDFWEYDTISNTWIQKTNFGGAARRQAVGFSIGSRGYIGTGDTGTGTQDFWEYDTISNTWTQKANYGGMATRTAAGFSIGSKGYIGTGWNGASNFQQFWEYTPELTANAGTDTSVICAGDSVIIGGSPTASGGNGIYTYSWTPSAGLNDTTLANPTASPSDTTTYIVTVTDSNGCIATDSMKLSVLLTANAGTDTSVICAGDSVIIGGSPTASGGNGIYTYSWTPSAGLNDTTLANPTASPSDITTYIVTVTDSIGCIATDSMKLSVFSSGIQTSAITGPTSVNVNAIEIYTVAFHAGSIYDWSVIGGNQTNGGQTNFINIQWGTIGTGQVTVVETDSLGCVVDTVALIVNIGGTGINENQPESIGINIYPNPNTGEFTVEIDNFRSGNPAYELRLYNMSGLEISRFKITRLPGGQVNQKSKFYLNIYAKGIYNLQLLIEGGVINKKITIE